MERIAPLPSSDTGFSVRFEDFSYFAPGGVDRPLLKSISLTIAPGESVTVVGSNGSGKSTLLKAITGELDPAGQVHGRVRVANETVDRPINQLIDGVGIVHQDPDTDLIPELSVAQNLSIRQILGGGHRHFLRATPASWRRNVAARIGGIQALTGVSLDRTVRTLSGGQRQALSVWVASSFEHESNPCRLLVLDEYTASLDAVGAESVTVLTRQIILATHATAVTVTHRLGDAIRFTDRILLLHEGTLHSIIDPHTITAEALAARMANI